MVKSTATVFRKKVCAGCSENDCPDDPHHSDELCRGKASDLFGELTGIAVLLTMCRTSTLALTWFVLKALTSATCQPDLLCTGLRVLLHRANGPSSFELAGTFIVSLIILMFYLAKCMSARATQWITTQRLTQLIKSIFRGSSFHFVPCVGRAFFTWRYDYERYCNIESHGGYFKEEPIRELHRALERLNFQLFTRTTVTTY